LQKNPWRPDALNGRAGALDQGGIVKILALSSLGLLLALAGSVRAQTNQEIIGGTVLSTGNTSFVIRTGADIEKTFVISTSTLMPTLALEAGDPVTVRYRPLDPGHNEAVEVTLLAESDLARQANDSLTARAARGWVPILAVAGLAALAAGFALRLHSHSTA
jgi:hypothetical protein